MSDDISARLTRDLMDALKRHTPGILDAQVRDTAVAMGAISTAAAAVLAAVKLAQGEKAYQGLREYMHDRVATAADEILQKATLDASRKPAGHAGSN